ncbi:MAG: Potassium-transporting ATPase KdpC subunit [Turneriella sp.]|nr:Potassium-transporting ATPase KdpC subunit [Turneriella sp.]
MLQQILISLRIFLLLTVICGGIYPLLVTAVANLAFPQKAQGSLVYDANGKLIGSEFIAQKFSSAHYFWPRPSAGDYATVSSAASNKGPTSADLKKSVDERKALYEKTGVSQKIPAEMLFASASGLDPHISPEGARIQVERIAKARKYTKTKIAELYALIDKTTEARQFGFLGEERVNVLKINVALDKL